MPKAITCRCGCQEWYLIVDEADALTGIRCAACGKRFLGAVSAKPVEPTDLGSVLISRKTQ